MIKYEFNVFTGKLDLVDTGSSGGGDFTPSGVTTATVGGIIAGTDLGTSPIPIQTILTEMLYPYTAPTISLVSSPVGVREPGNNASPALTATYTEHSNPITAVTMFRGVTLIYTDPSPSPTGGTSMFTDTGGYTTTTVTYTAKVTDGTTTTTSNSQTITAAFAYYYGVGAQGLTPAQVAALTKLVIANTATLTESFTTVNQVAYFAYPDSYPALTSIKDINGFETISSWNVSTGNSITNGFSQTTTYRIYEFQNLTTVAGFQYTFKQ